MYLRDIGISIVKTDDMPAHLPSIYLREAEHVVDILLHFLPRKFTLDGTAKTNLVLGPLRDSMRYRNMGEVNQFVLSEFERDKYYASAGRQRDELILDALESCLLEIANIHAADAWTIREAAAKTRQCDFALKRESKLSRSTSSRGIRLHVFQHLSRQSIEWTLEIRSRSGEIIDTVEIGKSNSWESSYKYRKSKWVENTFVIFDHVGQVSFRYNAAEAERTAMGK